METDGKNEVISVIPTVVTMLSNSLRPNPPLIHENFLSCQLLPISLLQSVKY